MSMVHDMFYLIEPRPELAAQLQGRTDPDFAEILTEPVLIRNREGGRSFWTTDDHAIKVKLLFLTRLREYSPLASDEDAMRILESPRISVGLFDKWWVIRPFGIEDDTEGMLAYLRPLLGKVDPSGNPRVDGWLAWVGDRA
jgi:hypothetical protein